MLRALGCLRERKGSSLLTPAAHAVPLPDALSHLLRHVYAVAVEPLVTLVTATGGHKTSREEEGHEIETPLVRLRL